MQQVPVRRVQLNEFCPCGLGTSGCRGKSFNDRADFCNAEGLRNLIALTKCQSAGRKNRSPAALGGSAGLAAIPWLVGAGFPAGVCQLDTRHRALVGDKCKSSPQRLNVGVSPDAQVLRADAAIRGNGRGFCNDGGGTPYGTG